MTTVQIKRQGIKPTVVLLSAGVGTRIKTYEPRCLINYKSKTLIDHQIKTIENSFGGCDIVVVCGYDAHKVNKKVQQYPNVRVVENELFSDTGSASSMRLATNNISNDKIVFIHGDIIFNNQTLNKGDYSRSFLIVDRKGMINQREVGVVVEKNNCAANLSFGLEEQPRWGQVCYFTGDELKKLRKIINVNSDFNKKQLSFELINEIIDSGGEFKCIEPNEMQLFELDSMKEFLDSKVNI